MKNNNMKRFSSKRIISCMGIIFSLMTAPLVAQEQASADVMFPNLVMTKYHYTKVKELVGARGANFTKMAYLDNIRTPVNEVISKKQKPTPFVSLKNNPNKIDADTDMNIIYKLSIAYLVDLNVEYLDKAVEYLEAWAKVNVAVTNNNIHETVFTPGIEGYSVIRNAVDEISRDRIDAWVRQRGNIFMKDNVRDNNWGTALLQQILYCGRTINDEAMINKVKNTYPTWAPKNLYPNGTTEDLLGRDAFAYHSFDLLFFGKIGYAIAMYDGFAAADQFYTQDVKWGASVKKSVHFWIPFLLDPIKNTHIEFKNTEWDGDKSRSDYNKIYNPGGTIYAVDELYLFDKENLNPVIKKYRGGNEYGTWRLFLNALRWQHGDEAPKQ